VLIVAGLAIFVLLVVPFLTFRDQLAEMQDREAALAKELQAARSLVAETRVSHEKLSELRDSVFRYYAEQTEFQLFEDMEQEAAEHALVLEELRADYARSSDPEMLAWVRGEVRAPPEEIVKMDRRLFGLSFEACYWDSGLDRVTCQLCEDFRDRHQGFAWSLSRLPAVSESAVAATTEDLGAIAERACGWLTAGEPHWRRQEVFPGDDIHRLRGWLSLDLMAYLERLDAFEQTVLQSLPERELQVEHLARRRAATTDRLAVLEGQLERIASFDQVGTPIGDLPVGLGQIVLLFPVALAFGFLAVANSHARAARTQRAFARLCRKRDTAGEVMDDEYLAAVAPLWLDPREPLGARLAKWAVLLTPLALTLANLLLIYRTEALTAQLPEDSAIPPAAYVALYAVTLAVFAGTLRHIWRAGHPDAAEPKADRPDTGSDSDPNAPAASS